MLVIILCTFIIEHITKFIVHKQCEQKTPRLYGINTTYIYVCLCNYGIRCMKCTLISVLICWWLCGWVILALHQPAGLWVELCDSLVPQRQYAYSRIVAHLTDCDMDCMGCLFSMDLLSDFLHKHVHLHLTT